MFALPNKRLFACLRFDFTSTYLVSLAFFLTTRYSSSHFNNKPVGTIPSTPSRTPSQTAHLSATTCFIDLRECIEHFDSNCGMRLLTNLTKIETCDKHTNYPVRNQKNGYTCIRVFHVDDRGNRDGVSQRLQEMQRGDGEQLLAVRSGAEGRDYDA